MTSKGQARFDIACLRDLAGAKAFQRGESYFRSDQVQILSVEASRVLAQVDGTDSYRTELRGRGTTISGHCSCPAYEEWGFCKHLVAVGLAANASGEGEAVGVLSRIRDHLKTKSVDDLADMIVQLAESDAGLFRRLELASVASQADDKTLETRLRTALDAATRTAEYVDYSSAGDWAVRVEEALDAIEALLPDRAAIVLKLAERAIYRIASALESVDDSDGDCGVQLARAQEIHLAAVSALQPDPVELARDLFAREMNDEYEVFYDAVSGYADVLGEGGLAEYRRLAEAAWKKLPGTARKSEDESGMDRARLRGILDFFAERDGDVDARIAFRMSDLTSAHGYLQLAEFCQSQGRGEQALNFAEEGLWKFEDGQLDKRLVVFTADLLVKAGRANDAEAHLWRTFEKSPDLDLYRRLRKLGGDAAHERALTSLRSLCARKDLVGWRNPVDLLVEILLQEKAYDEAWASFRKYRGSTGLKEELASRTEKTHPKEAVEVYEARVEHLATSGGNFAYEEAAKLVARMAKLRGAKEQTTYVVALKQRHARRRNFMKLLG